MDILVVYHDGAGFSRADVSRETLYQKTGLTETLMQSTMVIWLPEPIIGNRMATLAQDFPLSATDDQTMLAPFEIWEVPYGEATIKFHEPLILTPTWMPHDPDEPGDVEYLQIIYPELEIDVCAETRDELLAWVHSEIFMNWKHFVSKDDAQLNAGTLPIKRKYLAVAEVIDG